ncbi:unnamed protein product [Linum tenue]|uniref:Uncharacterized protein n=1 Tax=Linum tenue TaxID=586396 RepID=A0AAV0KT09_9ROSI|nr:unnamed protein product [Linum tenue]
MFTGPATGLWLCGPLMSLIDTVVIGQGSSLELAALRPGTVFCDYICYVFMFLSVATSLARQVGFFFLTSRINQKCSIKYQYFCSLDWYVECLCCSSRGYVVRGHLLVMETAFAGQRNLDLIPAANTYVQDSRMRNFASTFQTMFYLLILIIKGLMSSVLFSQILGLAWPAVLVGWVAQSASPLQIFRLWYSWAAWATMVSQVVAAFMMIDTLNKKCYNALAISVPMFDGLLRILGLAAPVFITMTSKMHGVLLPFFIALAVTPCNHNLEGTLMVSCFIGCSISNGTSYTS